jgi:metal-dependent amidase/aminoacylase/carboxypeptidase family protein
MRDLAETRINDIVRGVAAAHGAEAKVNYHPQLSGHLQPRRRDRLRRRRRRKRCRCRQGVEREQPPTMGGEDFSFMLEARPGAFIFMGNGDTARPAPPGL